MTIAIHPLELFHRYEGNPVLCAADFPQMVNAVFNPAAVRFQEETLLLVRIEARSGLSHLAVATSADGRTGWQLDPIRRMDPELDTFAEHWGIEDPRITAFDGRFFVAYTGYSAGGPLVCLATTTDFVTFERHGVIMSPEDKDAALFPAQFDGRWALLHRPVPASNFGAHVWISFSPDLRHWGDSTVLLPARRGGWWDANKVGLGPPPLATRAGWLICYHGVKATASGSIYRLGLALLDRNHPERVIARGNEWVFGPQASYERQGDVPDVVFPCGWILRDDGDTLDLYYGAADSVVCLATASLNDLLDHLLTHPAPVAPTPGG
jgi:predicted GH43/DUF377 family glycosyl hydrolase